MMTFFPKTFALCLWYFKEVKISTAGNVIGGRRGGKARLCRFRIETTKAWTGLLAPPRRPIQWCSVSCTASMKLFFMSRFQLVHSSNELWDRPAGILHITVWQAGIVTTKFPGKKNILKKISKSRNIVLFYIYWIVGRMTQFYEKDNFFWILISVVTLYYWMNLFLLVCFQLKLIGLRNFSRDL